MASIRESSPASESGSTSTPQLSPNSKIKAMLAALDSDSDDENISGSLARYKLLAALKKSPAGKNANLESTKYKKNTGVDRNGLATASEEEEEEVVRPRGRLAAAMRAPESDQDEASSGDDGHAKTKKTPTVKNTNPKSPTSTAQSGSEESDTPVKSRKRKIRTARQQTPEAAPEEEPQSPGLFVSPTQPKSANAEQDSDSDELPENPATNNRFNALVEKKRQELQAKEREAAAAKSKKAAERRRHADILEEDDVSDDSDDNGGRRLTQQVRPTRKASKRALEDISRETQRLSRNQQLTHIATTKKKFSVSGLMARFNYGGAPKETTEQSTHATSSSSAPHSDVEMNGTPPTSPASHSHDSQKDASEPVVPMLLDQVSDGEELPTMEELAQISSSSPVRLDKGKGKATEEEPVVRKEPVFKQRPIRVRLPTKTDKKSSPLDDSDSDLEFVSTITPKKKTKLDLLFDRVPANQAKESASIHVLRTMAHLTSPGKQTFGKNKKPSMTTVELQMSLQQRARQQAAREREERLQSLRDKGVIVQTAEQRQQEMAEVEDLMTKARREGEEITKREKAAAKQERKERGEVDPLGDSSDDEDWKEETKEEIPEEDSGSEDEELEGSGSENGDASGEDDGEDMELDAAEKLVKNPLLDNEASETDEDEEEAEINHSDDGMIDDGNDEEGADLPLQHRTNRRRNVNVISDDEDEAMPSAVHQTPLLSKSISPAQLNSDSPIAPHSVLRSATKTFIPGLTVYGPVGLGLTQIFAGTMDDSQVGPSPSCQESQPGFPEPDNLAFLRRLPAPELPPFIPTMEEDTQMVANSQSQISNIPASQIAATETQGLETQELDLSFSQSQVHGFDSLVDNSQMSPFPDATQDLGFQHLTPIKSRFFNAPPSTIDTLITDPTAVPEAVEDIPIIKKKGKLRRRAPVVEFSDEEGETAEPLDIGEDEFDIDENFFDVMRKASKKKIVVDEFDKKKSNAKDLVNEQADESEDEYAGLGGASDDESGGEADEFVKAMIDDEGGKYVDESKVAAFFADRERADDEKRVEKLYKDITNGMLRKKRGADYDLSDSDDGGEARRRMKRKEFTKMRKALLADERLGKIAENPKQQAFLRAIEDRGSGDDMDFLDDFAEKEDDSQSQTPVDNSQQVVPNSQPTNMGPPKRKRSDDESQEPEARLPPQLRRTKPAKKPSNISEIRESLSSLIEEPNAMIAQESASDSDDDLEIEGDDDLGPRSAKEKENRDPFALRRSHNAVIDRISLKRATSSSLSNNTRLAFAASSSVPGFKVPALLRRATTNSSIVSTSSSVSGATSGTERTAGGTGGDGVRRGGGKNSGVNYFARETERRAAVEKTTKRREQKLFKGAESRRKVVGGLFGGGKFE